MIDKILNDQEKVKVGLFVEDTVMFEAVKKVLLAGIYYNGVLKPGVNSDPLQNYALSLASNPGISNEILGQDLRATSEGIMFLENGLKKLKDYKPAVISPIQQENPAI